MGSPPKPAGNEEVLRARLESLSQEQLADVLSRAKVDAYHIGFGVIGFGVIALDYSLEKDFEHRFFGGEADPWLGIKLRLWAATNYVTKQPLMNPWAPGRTP